MSIIRVKGCAILYKKSITKKSVSSSSSDPRKTMLSITPPPHRHAETIHRILVSWSSSKALFKIQSQLLKTAFTGIYSFWIYMDDVPLTRR